MSGVGALRMRDSLCFGVECRAYIYILMRRCRMRRQRWGDEYIVLSAISV